MIKKEIDFQAIGALILAMAVWASSFIALKSAIGPIGPMSVIFLRMLLASFCFLFFIKKFTKLSFTKTDVKYLILMTVFEPCLYFIFEAHALKNTSAGQAGMITSMMPLITAIGAGFFLKEVVTKNLIIGSIIAMSGAIWLSISSQTSTEAINPLLGNTLELCAMICGAGYAISIRHLSSKFNAVFLTAIQAFIGAIFFFPFALWEYLTTTMHITLDAVLWVVYLGVFVTLGGYGMFNFALGRMEAGKASVYINLIPIFTLLLAFIILGEKLSFTAILASCIIFAGVFISQFSMPKSKKLKK